MTGADRKTLLARTAPAAAKGEWEKYKVSDMFDGTGRNPALARDREALSGAARSIRCFRE